MTGPIIDYQAVLDDLYAKRAQIDAAIDGIRAMSALSGTPLEDPGTATTATSPAPASPKAPRSATATHTGGIANDTFFGMSTSEAVKKFLAMMKRPQSPRVIADALVAGGQVHAVDAEVGYTNTYTALRRLGKSGVAVQIKSGDWGLSEWYSNKPKSEGD